MTQGKHDHNDEHYTKIEVDAQRSDLQAEMVDSSLFYTKAEIDALLVITPEPTLPEPPPATPPPLDPIPSTDITVNPGGLIQATVDANSPGTSFLLKAGEYLNQTIRPKAGMSFFGEPGAVLNGTNTTVYAFNVEVDGVTIDGLEIKNYANPAESGALNGTMMRVANCDIHHNRGAGISVAYEYTLDGNNIHHNGQIGIVSWTSQNARVVNNEIANNNPDDTYEYAWEAGGTKFLGSDNLYAANNYVHDNHGAGLWTDANNFGTLYENNTCIDNYGPGIFHEISGSAVIRNNVVEGNAHPFYIGGILVSSSFDVEVYGNTLSGNDGGIVGLQDDRGSGPRGLWQTTNLNVHDNQVAWNVGINGVQVNAGPDVTQTNTIRFDNNVYTTNLARPFKWGKSSLTLAEWQALGFDTV